jgi:hypothetical protein
MAYKILQDDYYTQNISLPGGIPGVQQYGLRYDPSNGDYVLSQKSAAGYTVGVGLAVLFKNGSWTSDAIQDSKLFTNNDLNQPTQLAKDLSLKMNKQVYQAYKDSGGVAAGSTLKINDAAKPQYQGRFLVNNAAAGTNPGISSIFGTGLSNPIGQGNIFDFILGPPTFNVDFTSANEKKLFGDVLLLTYPVDILKNNQDTFVITQYNYQAPGGDVFAKPELFKSVFGDGGLQRNSAIKDFIGTVVLPMPNKVVDQNAVSWSGDTMSTISMGVGGYVYQKPGEALGGQALAQAGVAALEAKYNIKIPPEFKAAVIQGFTVAAASGGTSILQRADMRAIVTSLLAKGAGFDIPPETILSRGYGVVPNSNLELLFNGPILRGFTFGYRMTPRSQKEAENVRRIIRFFKQGMAARKMSGQAGAGSAFLKSPNVFKLRYKSAGKPIPGVNKFKICALTQFGVDYTPESQWTAYEDPSSPGQPVSVVMSLQFNELEPVYESDYQDANYKGIFKGLERDLEPVTDNDVGY